MHCKVCGGKIVGEGATGLFFYPTLPSVLKYLDVSVDHLTRDTKNKNFGMKLGKADKMIKEYSYARSYLSVVDPLQKYGVYPTGYGEVLGLHAQAMFRDPDVIAEMKKTYMDLYSEHADKDKDYFLRKFGNDKIGVTVQEEAGTTLFQRLKNIYNGSIPRTVLNREAARNLWEGLAVYHSAGIAHTDLHKNNIVLGGDRNTWRFIDMQDSTTLVARAKALNQFWIDKALITTKGDLAMLTRNMFDSFAPELRDGWNPTLPVAQIIDKLRRIVLLWDYFYDIYHAKLTEIIMRTPRFSPIQRMQIPKLHYLALATGNLMIQVRHDTDPLDFLRSFARDIRLDPALHAQIAPSNQLVEARTWVQEFIKCLPDGPLRRDDELHAMLTRTGFF